METVAKALEVNDGGNDGSRLITTLKFSCGDAEASLTLIDWGRATPLILPEVTDQPRPRLIEVALPLAAINAEAAREKKSIRQGHPATLHLWWARIPFVAARAVIWASLVDDPSGDPSLSAEEQEAERQRLFGILERLVKWENSNNGEVLAEARAEIDRCFPDGPPPILDPFAGGGAIPLEASRLGLTALASDLNPVAVLINKAMIEIPPRFADLPPVHPDARDGFTTWERAQGLAADVEAYGRWMRDEAQRRIGHLYPDAVGSHGQRFTPIAWIWARTVESPDPSWSGHVPLVASWTLAKRPGKPQVWIEPIIDHDTQTISYEIREGGQPSYDRTVERAQGTCLATGAAIPSAYIKAQGRDGRLGQQLIAVVAQSDRRGRVYCSPTNSDESVAQAASPRWLPQGSLPRNTNHLLAESYGSDEWWQLFTARQLVALTTFSDLLDEVSEQIQEHAKVAGLASDEVRLSDGGRSTRAYADAVVTLLAFAINKSADSWSNSCTWIGVGETVKRTFGRQFIPMTWDFAEVNPFSTSAGSWMKKVEGVAKAIAELPASKSAWANQRDARASVSDSPESMLSTDLPNYDNIQYADISDFFYLWMRKNLAKIWPKEFATMATPKAEELVANRWRAGSAKAADRFFEAGMSEFMDHVSCLDNHTPATIYYTYKTIEINKKTRLRSASGDTLSQTMSSEKNEIQSTGWDKFLQTVVDAGLQIKATWPIRTLMQNRLGTSKSKSLSYSIVLTCRNRHVAAQSISRGEFVAALYSELPKAIGVLQSGNIAPVDLAQSVVGPGLNVFSRYQKVVEADGSSMPVSAALAIINNVLGETLDGAEADLDADTRFALTWFTEHGYNPAPSGDADVVARAKNTSVAGVESSGIGEFRAGNFRLFERGELAPDWSPASDDRLTVWEATQYLAAALERSETDAAELLHALGGYGHRARSLTYLLYQKASDRGWDDEASVYNNLITAWPSLRTHRRATPS